MTQIFFTKSLIGISKGAKGSLQPASREALILTLLEMLGHTHATPLAPEILRQIDARPPASDPTLREVRLLKLAFALVDYGLRLAASSPLKDEMLQQLLPVLVSVEQGELREAQKATDVAQEVLELMETALLENEQPNESPTHESCAIKKRLQGMIPCHD